MQVKIFLIFLSSSDFHDNYSCTEKSEGFQMGQRLDQLQEKDWKREK